MKAWETVFNCARPAGADEDRVAGRPRGHQGGVRLPVLSGAHPLRQRVHMVSSSNKKTTITSGMNEYSDVFVFLSTRGKGDYHRLGHGTDDHVRRPRKVSSLQGKKIISIATGEYYETRRQCMMGMMVTLFSFLKV